MQKVVIFGATSAIAHATARLLVARGCSVFAVGRHAGRLSAVIADLEVRRGPDQVVAGIGADLDVISEHARLFDAAHASLGGIDTVLIAHGILPDQAACAAATEPMLAAIQTNAISAVALASEAARRLGRGGIIAAIGSVAGDRGRQSNYVYGAAKGMLALFLQGLRNQLSAQGVHVLTIKPGFVDTPMTAGIRRKGPLWASPERVAAGIVGALEARRDVVYLPWFWAPIMWIIKSIPERMFKRMSL